MSNSEPKKDNTDTKEFPVSTKPPLLFNEEIFQQEIKFQEDRFGITLLSISSISGVGKKTISDIFDLFKGELWQIWNFSPEKLDYVLGDISRADKLIQALKINPNHLLETGQIRFEKLKNQGIKILAQKELPKSLQEINTAPRWLFIAGNSDLLSDTPMIALVGTRKPTSRGIRATEIVSEMIAPYPITVVSGLADGIDKEAHEKTMAKGNKNIAFLGHGIDIVFPADTSATREKIINNGGVVATEYLLQEPYLKQNFVERNRLQAALADIVIPVEANISSGTAHTVRFARKFNTRVIGISWNGANGIVEDIKANQEKVIRVDNNESLKEFDLILQELLKKAKKKDIYPFGFFEKSLERELSRRNISKKDIPRLRKFIKNVTDRSE